MKRLIGAVAAVFSLAGCVAVPAYTEPGYPGYAPGYYYAPPAATFSFGFDRFHDRPGFRHGPRHGLRHGPRHGPRHGSRRGGRDGRD